MKKIIVTILSTPVADGVYTSVEMKITGGGVDPPSAEYACVGGVHREGFPFRLLVKCWWKCIELKWGSKQSFDLQNNK